MLYKKLIATATIPTRKHTYDAGVDLCSTENIILSGMMRILNDRFDGSLQGCTYLFDTGIAVDIPPGYVGIVCDKSGRGNNLIKVFGGIIDSGYRDSIKIRLMNMGFDDWLVKPGMAIAQMIVTCCDVSDVIDVGDEDMSSSERGMSGFGSQDLTR